MSSPNILKFILAIAILCHICPQTRALPPPMLRAVCGAFADAEEAVGNTAMAAGKAAVDIAMKPIAIVGGLKTAAVGASMKFTGGAVKFVGEKMAKDGALLEGTGAAAKGIGLGVAAMAVKPAAEGIIGASKQAEGQINAASAAAEGFAKSLGDTSIQIDAAIDSPLVGHHHQGINVTSGLSTAIHGQAQEPITQQLVDQQQQQIGHPISKRATKIDTEVLRAALNLVREAKMEDCVARAICNINCDPQGFGPDGKQVFMNMVRVQGANVLEEKESRLFHDAVNKGRGLSGKCSECDSTYKCTTKSADLIKLASHIRMD